MSFATLAAKQCRKGGARCIFTAQGSARTLRREDHGIRRGNGSRGRTGARRRGTQPSRRKPGTRNGELRPAAIETDADIRRGGHGRMAEGTGAVAIEADLRRDDGNRAGLALRANHAHTSELQVRQSEPNNAISGRKSTVIGTKTPLQQEEAETTQLSGGFLQKFND